MNFSPEDVKFSKYVLPGALGKAEPEEVAARYISLCQENGNQWVGINLLDFCETLDRDARNIKEVSRKTQTLIVLDLARTDGGTDFFETGLSYLIGGQYITIEKTDEEALYFFPTQKLLKAVEKFVSK